MEQEFFLRVGSVNPPLRMELIKDGRYDYRKSLINNALQDSVVKFSMRDRETGILKVANANADIVLAQDEGCEEKYILQYKWTERDVKKEGIYEGWFEIKFNGNIVEDGVDYPTGNLKVPVQTDLIIYIR
jgi:hypothetical protein